MMIAGTINVGVIVTALTLVGINQCKNASNGPFIGESAAEISQTTTTATATHTSEKSPGLLFLVTLYASFTEVILKGVT